MAPAWWRRLYREGFEIRLRPFRQAIGEVRKDCDRQACFKEQCRCQPCQVMKRRRHRGQNRNRNSPQPSSASAGGSLRSRSRTKINSIRRLALQNRVQPRSALGVRPELRRRIGLYEGSTDRSPRTQFDACTMTQHRRTTFVAVSLSPPRGTATYGTGQYRPGD